ncbi:MAG: phage tail tape measure protein [Chloroflexota bacterium]
MIDLGSALGKIIIDADDALKSTERLGGAMSGLMGPAGAMGGAVLAAGAAAGGALVALGASSVGIASEFQSSMAIMSTAVSPESLGVNSTAEAMAILSDASLAVGADTALVGVSASSASEAMTGLYKAGLSTGEIFGDLQGYLAGTAELGGALRASIDLAAASELDMVQASDLAAITLATFGGGLETTEERAAFVESAMNNFVQTADASVASVSDLQAAFVNVGPTAAALGFGVEDVNTALGILSTRGIAGSEAGTALKSMFTNMMRDTPGVTGALEDLGVSLYDLEGNMRSIPEIMGQFEAGLAGMTEEQRNQYIQTIAGTYGMNAMNSLLAEGVIGWEEMEAAVGEAATMQETAAARTATLAGAQEALGGVWESFQIKVGTALIPALMALADIGASLIEKYGPVLTAAFEGFATGVSRIIAVVTGGQLAEMFTIFEDGSSVLGSIFESFGMGEESANRLAAGISSIVTAVQTALAPIIAAVAQFVSFKDVLIALGLAVASVVIPAIISIVTAMAPILLTVGAVIGAIALLRNAWENDWGGIQGKVAAFWNAAKPILTAVAEWVGVKVRDGLATLRDFWNEAWPKIQTALENTWAVVKPILEAVGQFLVERVKSNLQTLHDFWVNMAWPAIQRVVEVVWPIIRTIFEAIGTFITQTLIPTIRTLYEKWTTEWWPTIQTVLENVWTVISTIFEEIGRWINDNIVPWVEYLNEVWSETVWPAIQKALETAWAVIEPIWEAIREWAEETLPPVIEALQRIFETVMSGISAAVEPVKAVWDGFVNAVTGFWDWIKDKVFNFEIHLPDLPDWAVPGSPLPIHTAWLEFSQDMNEIGERIGNSFQAAFDSLPDAAEQTEALFGTINSLGGLGSGFARIFQDQRLGPLQDELDNVTAAIEDMGQALNLPVNFMTDPFTQLRLMQMQDDMTLSAQQRDTARVMLSFMEERSRLNNEYIEQQERLAVLEEKQAQASFLKQQLDLLNLIRENNLDASILEGLTLGLDADAGDLMDAMSAAMLAMIAAAEKTLGIASPSTVFRGMTRNVKDAMVLEMADRGGVVSAVQGMVGEMVGSAQDMVGRLGERVTDASRTLHVYGGVHAYLQQPRRGVLDDLQEMMSP